MYIHIRRILLVQKFFPFHSQMARSDRHPPSHTDTQTHRHTHTHTHSLTHSLSLTLSLSLFLSVYVCRIIQRILELLPPSSATPRPDLDQNVIFILSPRIHQASRAHVAQSNITCI
ncbi:hypothetical protein BDV35DRAFT_138868 [Aspergillus flavus]|uniref:Uncharacterized protein n=1 Tax=Aspergillus flavus TaxID=5059 RepID=A0A5N6GCU0_ASPFL|nr:hypothetical protein BDV35DRAFT_138868 [Aspergillus flavus]